MKKVLLLACFMLSVVQISFAETHLADELKEKILDSSGNPYIIDQDVVIPNNSQVTIKAGVVFLFKSFTGINIYGSLIVEGTADKPVIFTSINDNNYNPGAEQLPNAFDWNGIYVSEESGNIKLRNFKLMYSVFGIKSKKDDITLQNGYFKQNGQFHFTINDNIHYVQDNISYSYNTEQKVNGSQTQQKPEESAREKPAESKKKSKSATPSGSKKTKRAIGFSLLGVGGACGVAALITGIKTQQYINSMNDILNDFNQTGDSAKITQWNNTEHKYETVKGWFIGTTITFGVSVPLSLFLFISDNKSTTIQKVSVNFEAGPEKYGIGFTTRF